MKKFLLTSLIAIFLNGYSYKLLDKWLVPDPIVINQSDTLYNHIFVGTRDSLANFNFSSCISDMNSYLVNGMPSLSAGGIDNDANYLVRYAHIYDQYGTFRDTWYGIHTTGTTTQGENETLTITLNDSAFAPWGNVSPSTTMVDINTTLRHELGHALGLDHSEYPTCLMAVDSISWTNPIKYIANDEINGLRATYEKPSVQVLSSHVAIDDTMKVFFENSDDSIEFQINTSQLLEYNSVFPPDLSLDCFFSNTLNSEAYIMNPDSLGNNIYIIKESISDLMTYFGDSTIKLRSFVKRVGWDYNDYTSDSPCGEVCFRFAPKPTIESPLPNEIYPVSPSEKGAVTDTLSIKVKVPELLGSFPEIDIKIDDSYVPHGDIYFDSNDSLWVYDWVISGLSAGLTGKKYYITSEITGNTNSNDVTSIYIVEAIYYEDFQTMTSLSTAGWSRSSWETPELPYTGWWLDVDALDSNNVCVVSQTQHSNTLTYYLKSPGVTVPDSTDRKTIITYNIFYAELEETPPFSKLYFRIYDLNDHALMPQSIELQAINNQWVTFSYDVSEFAGQTIRFRWHNYYTGTILCNYDAYCLDDVLVYSIPDMTGPDIDFIAGNTADIDEDMNLTLQFNDNSDIDGVTADYSIESDSDTITLNPMKGTYNYTGTIPARDHECNGSISFKIKDSVGNITISNSYNINWVAGGGYELSAPENVVITSLNDSTEAITWDIVPGATGYKVYSSLDPYGTFVEDSTGTFTESRKWEKVIVNDKYFYYIIATDAVKKEELEIIEPKELRY